LLAVARPSTWPIVMLIQAANLCSYTLFLLGYSHLWLRGSAIFMTCALGSLIWLFVQKDDGSVNVDNAGVGPPRGEQSGVREFHDRSAQTI